MSVRPSLVPISCNLTGRALQTSLFLKQSFADTFSVLYIREWVSSRAAGFHTFVTRRGLYPLLVAIGILCDLR